MMMNENLFEILDEIIDNRFKISNSGGVIEIIENNNATCKNIKIQLTGKTFSLTLDNNVNVFNCFNSAIANITKKNDAILFFEQNRKIIVLLMELKSNNPGDYLNQLKAGKNFVEYLIKQIELFYPFNGENIHYFGALFQTRKVPIKQTTKKKNFVFEDRNGLYCTTLKCNQQYKLQQFKESIKEFLS